MSKSNKEKTQNGLICLIDALGARQAKPNYFLKSQANMIKRLWKNKEKFASKHNYNWSDDLDILSFGDTIVFLWPIDDEPELYLEEFGYYLRSVIYWGLENEIPFRGAVSSGAFLYRKEQDNTAILGPAVADAAAWHQMADWIGIILTPSCGLKFANCSNQFDSYQEKMKFPLGRLFIEYNVPLKPSRKLRLWSIAWPATNYWSLKKPEVHPKLKLLGQLNKIADEIPFGAESKYQNTLAFFDWYSANVCPEYNKKYYKEIKNIPKSETND